MMFFDLFRTKLHLSMLSNPQLLLENLHEAIFLLDNNGYVIYCNSAASSLTGFSSAELLNHSLSTSDGSEDLIKTGFEVSLARKNGILKSEGWRFKKDGSKYWGELLISSLKDDSGDITGYSCTLRDNTEKKNEELRLRASEEKFRLIVEAVKDYCVFMMDPIGNIVTWNEGGKLIKGYLAEEVIGKHFSLFYTKEDLEAGKPETELRIAAEKGGYDEEGWRVRKNGSVFWASVVVTALYNMNNKLVGFSKVTRDLTEKKSSEELLRQSEERYRFLVEQVTDYGIFMLDENGRIISWNEGAKRIKGYTEQEILGKYFSIFYPEEDILNGKPAHELKVARKVGKYEEEGWRLRKDGSRFWANIVITAVYNRQGILIGFSKVTRDLTERKESERALRVSSEKYRQLAEELKITNEELTYINKELEQFTSIVSHDLQEPVRTVKSFLKLIEMKIDSGEFDQLKTYITKSVGAANRMKELILNLLHYAQLSKGELVREKVNTDELISKALQNVNTSMETGQASIEIHNEVKEVEGDPVQLMQLFQNLLSNAIKFTDSENPRIEIRGEKENGHVKFAVKDNGIGIARENLNKVFEIFRRLNTNKSYPGTGIGLAICKRIVDRHGGRIWPESEAGKGTTFYFTLNERANA
jgi:PAS domain S-box-containing protein